MKLKLPTLKNKITRMMDALDSPNIWNIWVNQVSNDKQTWFAMLVSSGHLKYVRGMVMVNDPVTELPTCVSYSGDGIQIGQLV